MRSLLPLVLAMGCMDYELSEYDLPSSLTGVSVHDRPTPPEADDSSGSSGSGSSGSGSSGSGSSGSGSSGSSGVGADSSGTDDSDDEAGSGASPTTARSPVRGDVIINELMIDPISTSDSEGEWVELWNVGDAWVDLNGARLRDDGVDDYELNPEYSDALILGPGEYLLVCADADWWSNGGVDCDAIILYQTFGGGFALSNSEDEVVLVSGSGTTLDRFEYGEGFAAYGASMGVDPDEATYSANDDEDEWCDQWDSLPFGDGGSPGRENDWCW